MYWRLLAITCLCKQTWSSSLLLSHQVCTYITTKHMFCQQRTVSNSLENIKNPTKINTQTNADNVTMPPMSKLKELKCKSKKWSAEITYNEENKTPSIGVVWQFDASLSAARSLDKGTNETQRNVRTKNQVKTRNL